MDLTRVHIKPSGLKSIPYFIEEFLCIAALVMMVLIPMSEVIASKVFRTGILGSGGLITHLLLCTGLLCGMICTRDNAHLSISLTQYVPEGTVKNYINTINSLVSAFTAIVIAWCSAFFLLHSLETRMLGFITNRTITAVIPIAFVTIAVRFARRTKLTGWKIVFPVLSIVLGTLAALPVIVKLYYGGVDNMPDEIYYFFMDDYPAYTAFAKIPLVIFMIIAAFGGTPLFIVIGGLSLLLLHSSGGQMDSVAADIYSSLTSKSFIAIPLFTLVGFFLSESKAGERLVNVFRSFFSWLPGGIIIVTVVICAFFTALTGASGVTIVALGGILYTILNEHLKYPEKFSIGLLVSVGSIGLLFPPSLPIILVGTVMQTDIRHFFYGGLIPGLIMITAMIVFGVIMSRRIKIPVEKFDGRRALSALKNSILEILLPVLLILGIFSGVLELEEAAAAAVIYIFIVEVLIHRDIKLSNVKNVFQKAIPIIGGVLSIIAVSKAFSYFIIKTGAPGEIANWLNTALSSKYTFLLLLNVVLIVVGCFMDIFSAIMVVLPLLVPIAKVFGIDPVHLGIVFLVNLEMGYITPPVGLNLFLAAYRFKKPFINICRYVSPFLIVRLVVVLLVTFIPWLTTGMVNLFTSASEVIPVDAIDLNIVPDIFEMPDSSDYLQSMDF